MIEGHYYDGRSARCHAVTLHLDRNRLEIHGDGVHRMVPWREVEVSERMARTPRRFTFTDGAFCQVTESAALAGQLAAAGIHPSLVERAQARWAMALTCCLMLLALGVAAHTWALPWAAHRAAESVPAAVNHLLSAQTLRLLDRVALQASTLPAARQQALRQALGELKWPDGAAVRHTLHFRASPRIGANAFALPDGTLVLLDELVALADDDRQLLAVLAHELGHVRHQHGLRLMIQSTVVGTFAAWWFGDVSALLATAPTVLAQARYSRGFETEADDYAVAMMRANGIPPSMLGEMLERLVQSHRPASATESGDDGNAQWQDYLASHPAPEQRIQRLREMR